MKFMLLLHADEAGWADFSPEEMKAAIATYAAYNRELAEAGVLVQGEQLKPSATTKTVSGRKGELAVVDGPFAESKEQMGGYYVLEVDGESDAIAWAEKCPAVHYGWVEVRELIPRPE
jgi:hypothetical protein